MIVDSRLGPVEQDAMTGPDPSKPDFYAEWLSAAETYRLATEHMPDGQARVAIGTRAHSGLLRTFAERFERDRNISEQVELLKEFWWAEGHGALEQNWVTGDFETWIRNLHHWKAFGVRFNRDDLLKMLPHPPPRQEPAKDNGDDLIHSGNALKLLTEAAGSPDEAAILFLDALKLGEVRAMARIHQVSIEGGPIVTAKDKWLGLEDWASFEEVPPLQWKNGILTCTYWHIEARETATVRISGLRFNTDGLYAFIASLPPATGKSAPDISKRPTGRPRADWWDDLLIAMFRRLWEDNWTPRTQAEVVEAMHQWLADNPGDDPDAPRQAGDTALKERARKLLEGLDLGR